LFLSEILAMSRHVPHRDRQLCAQIQEALYWVLGSQVGDETLALFQVVSVEPIPDATRLLVTLAVPDDQNLESAQTRLQKAAKAIRAEAAAAINRRKAPELVFRVMHL
jgi:ribosome-binding factor A